MAEKEAGQDVECEADLKFVNFHYSVYRVERRRNQDRRSYRLPVLTASLSRLEPVKQDERSESDVCRRRQVFVHLTSGPPALIAHVAQNSVFEMWLVVVDQERPFSIAFDRVRVGEGLGRASDWRLANVLSFPSTC